MAAGGAGAYCSHTLSLPTLQVLLVDRDPLAPQFLAGECRAFGQRLKLRPGDLRMNTAAKAAIRAGDDVFAADDLGVAHDAIGDDLRMLDDVGGMADHARN